jgi:hypothetical protein
MVSIHPHNKAVSCFRLFSILLTIILILLVILSIAGIGKKVASVGLCWIMCIVSILGILFLIVGYLGSWFKIKFYYLLFFRFHVPYYKRRLAFLYAFLSIAIISAFFLYYLSFLFFSNTFISERAFKYFWTGVGGMFGLNNCNDKLDMFGAIHSQLALEFELISEKGNCKIISGVVLLIMALDLTLLIICSCVILTRQRALKVFFFKEFFNIFNSTYTLLIHYCSLL